jgi:hypothetical protein
VLSLGKDSTTDKGVKLVPEALDVVETSQEKGTWRFEPNRVCVNLQKIRGLSFKGNLKELSIKVVASPFRPKRPVVNACFSTCVVPVQLKVPGRKTTVTETVHGLRKDGDDIVINQDLNFPLRTRDLDR